MLAIGMKRNSEEKSLLIKGLSYFIFHSFVLTIVRSAIADSLRYFLRFLDPDQFRKKTSVQCEFSN